MFIDYKCDYGCGDKANHVFKNGNRCCSKYPVQCPAVREKISESLEEYYKDNNKKKTTVISCNQTEFFE